MIRAVVGAAFVFATVTLGAVPRWYAPPGLRPGAVNEVFAWDEEPLGPFTVEVVRAGSERPLASARGLPGPTALTGPGGGALPLRWAAALVSPDALEAPGLVVVRFLGPGRLVLAEVLSVIQPREFPVEEIPLDGAMSELREKPNPRKDREAEAIWKVYERFEAGFPWQAGRFTWPVAAPARISARFGDTRRYLYADGTTARDYHRGVDFAVPTGTTVLASAPGTVVLVADRMLTGTSVVLEHGPGIYSAYFHLSRALVRTGQGVAAGAPIALSGATGLVTGSHLHWEIRVGGVPVDPLEVVAAPLLDTSRVRGVVSWIERPIQ